MITNPNVNNENKGQSAEAQPFQDGVGSHVPTQSQVQLAQVTNSIDGIRTSSIGSIHSVASASAASPQATTSTQILYVQQSAQLATTTPAQVAPAIQYVDQNGMNVYICTSHRDRNVSNYTLYSNHLYILTDYYCVFRKSSKCT